MPAAARVELTDEIQQSRAGGVEMSGQFGDLVAQSLELRNRFRRGSNGALKIAVHRRLSSLFCADSTPRFSTGHGDSRTGDRGVAGGFLRDACVPALTPPCTPRPPAARRR